MKRVASVLLVLLSMLTYGGLILATQVYAQAVLFASPTPGPSPANLNVDCAPNSMPSLSVFVPLGIVLDQPSGIRIVGAPEIFRGKRVWLFFENANPPSDMSIGFYTFSLPLNIDSVGNADVAGQSLDQLMSINPGTYRISIRGGPITTQTDGGPFVENYPICFEQTTYNVEVTAGTESCLDLGDTCTPGTSPNLCYAAQYAYCDDTQNPPRIRLPDLPPVILNNALCEYVSTPGSVTCAQALENRPITCGIEYMSRINSGDPSSPVGQITMCCESTSECGKAQGLDQEAGEESMVPFNACRQIAIPTGDPARAATQREKRDACCKCMTGDQSSFFVTSEQRCSGEVEAEEDPLQAANRGIYTAVGCISADATAEGGMVTTLVRIGIGLAGGVALLMILAGSFMFTTSQGDPKRANEAKELITSAVMGILFIIFSVTILQFIGVTVLHIPGFGS